MKKTGKRCLAVLLAAGMVFTGIQIPKSTQTVIAEETAQDGFVIENGVLKKYTGNSIRVTIPDGVEVIGKEAFLRNEKIESVTIPDSVHTIEDYAFLRCSNLCEVRFPEALKVLGTGAFGYTALQEADLSQTEITAVGPAAFEQCGELTYVSLPDTVLSIGSGAFYGDGNLSECILQEGIYVIGSAAFQSCTKLEEIALPTTLRSIGDWAFGSCQRLQEIVVPEGIETLTEGVFDGCTRLTSVSLPTSLKTIQSKAFAGGKGVGAAYVILKEITIPAGVVSIADRAFENGALTVIRGAAGSEAESFTKNYRNVDDLAVTFEAVSLDMPQTSVDTDVTLPEISEDYEGRNSDFTIYNGILQKYTGTENVVVVPEGVTKIGAEAFNGNLTATRIVLPEGVTEIGSYAFADCHALQEIVLPETLTTIGEAAFEDCTNLLKLQLPDAVKVIPKNMCRTCPSLLQLELGNAVTTIQEEAFANGNFNVSSAPVVHELKLPDTVTEIGENAFAYWDELTQLELPDGLTELGAYAFYRCGGLSEVSVPAGIKTLNTCVFADNYTLKSIRLQNGLTTLGDAVFRQDAKLTSVYLPKSITKAGDNLFQDSAVKTIYGERGSLAQTLAETYELDFYVLTSEQAAEQDAHAKAKNTSLPKQEKQKDTPNPAPQEKEYISITTVEQLNAIRENLDANYRLDANLDLTQAVATGGSLDVNGHGWQPIGVDENGFTAFTGTFDGNGYTIHGLSIRGDNGYVLNGLFGAVDGTVKNLVLDRCSVTVSTHETRGAGRAYGLIAGVVGYGDEDGSAGIEDCVVKGRLRFEGKDDITEDGLSLGGITGQLLSGTITKCQNQAEVHYQSVEVEHAIAPANHTIGGICGYKTKGNISNCSNTGAVTSSRALYCDYNMIDEWTGSKDYIQEIVDSIMGSGGLQIYNYAGGICGYVSGLGVISQCYNTADITNIEYTTFKGYSLKIQRAFTEAGGISGSMYAGTRIYDCYNTGDIVSNCNIESYISIIPGGMFDVPAPSVNNYSYAAGIVATMDSGLVKRCFSTGKLTGGAEETYGIANGSGVVSYCRYISDDTVTKGFTAYDDSLRRCKSMTLEDSPLAGVMVNDKDTYRGYEFGNQWVLGGTMPYPQLLDNMESSVESVELTGDEPDKKAYAYAQSLDTKGLQVKLTLEGDSTPVVVDIAPGRVSGYHSRQPGVQTLRAKVPGMTITFDVTVAEKIKKQDEEPSPSPSVSPQPSESSEPDNSTQPDSSEIPDVSNPPSGSEQPNVTTGPGVSEQPSNRMPGDANNDNKVDLIDAQLTLKDALKIAPLDAESKAAIDVNGDGKVDLTDAQLILKYALKIINSFDEYKVV